MSDQLNEGSEYSICLNPADWEDDWEEFATDCGDLDEQLPQMCPTCNKIYGGKTTKGYDKWISQHIRLHNLEARRRNLLKPEEIIAMKEDIFDATMEKISNLTVHSPIWKTIKKLGSTAQDLKELCLPAFSLVLEQIVPIVCANAPVFLRDETNAIMRKYNQLVTDQEFRTRVQDYCPAIISEDTQFSRFLTCLIEECRDQVRMVRLSKMRRRMMAKPIEPPKGREEIVMFLSGWVLFRMKHKFLGDECDRNEDQQKCHESLMDRMLEGGVHAEPVEEEMRRWIDKRDRGEVKDDGTKNGLSIPSKGAMKFFRALDTIVIGYESATGLRENLSFESVLSKAYDNLELLDAWNELTPDLVQRQQQTFLERVIKKYWRAIGHAIADKAVRMIANRRKVAVRTNLKKN